MSYKLPLFAAAAFLGGYMLISNRQLRVNKYELKVSKLPESFAGKKILLLADLHKKRYGDNFNNLVNSCVAAVMMVVIFFLKIEEDTKKMLEEKAEQAATF
jgi:predicted MPP superfamily phosphohydrolase